MRNKGPKIKKLLSEGKNYPTICNELGVAIATVAYHARQMNIPLDENITRKVDWDEVQTYYNKHLSLTAVSQRFNIGKATLFRAQKRGYIKKPPKVKLPNEDIFIEDSIISSSTLRRRIIKESLIPYECMGDGCDLKGSVLWAGRPISLHLDHINGVRNDHRISNLRWLCPNCHSQTETYCGRNKNGARGGTRTHN